MTHKRGKGKYDNIKNIPDMYEFYKQKYPSSKVTLKQYRTVIEKFNKHVADYLLEDAGSFKMPFGMGVIRIRKKAQDLKNLNLD